MFEGWDGKGFLIINGKEAKIGKWIKQ